MPQIVNTQIDNLDEFRAEDRLAIYNGLDCLLTVEVFEAIKPKLEPETTEVTYNFERSLLAPVLDMQERGFRIDHQRKREMIADFEPRIRALTGMEKDSKGKWHIVDPKALIQEYAQAIWGKPLNPFSPTQLKGIFYEALKIPEQTRLDKGQRKVTTNAEALEVIARTYPRGSPLALALLRVRELQKKIDVLNYELDIDDRMRTSFAISGTTTGRFSSSSSAFWNGGNLQNIEKELREVFIPDPGYEMFYADLKSAESFVVGYEAEDEAYIEACKSGDPHTAVTKLVWTTLPWTGDLKADKAIAKQPFYRQHSYRDMAKRGGHGCLTGDHEVLTPDGWVPITKKPSVIMQFSEEVSSFADVSHWEDHLYNGELQFFEGNSISAVMTHDHRVPYRYDMRCTIRERAAEAGPGYQMPLGWGYKGGNVVVPARLIAAFMADGHQKSKNRMEFHLKKARKIERLQELCNFYGYELEPRSCNKYIIKGNLPKYPGAFMFEWRRECLEDFVNELRYWDGSIGKTSVSISSTRREDLEWFQTFGRLVGVGGAIQKPRTSGYGSTCYVLQQNNRKWAWGGAVKHTKMDAVVQVYCPTVPSGWFYVRRNGKIFVTGNTNYFGTPRTIATNLKVEEKIIKVFQAQYYGGELLVRDLRRWGRDDIIEAHEKAGRGADEYVIIPGAFPGIRKWHERVIDELQTTETLTTCFGRKRQFWGRLNDKATWREAIAYVPQSTVGDLLNIGLFRLWRVSADYGIQILGNVHDAIVGQSPVGQREETEKIIRQCMEIPVTIRGREMLIPADVTFGKNWKEASGD